MKHNDDQNDAELVALVLGGERDAFGPLLTRVYPSVLRLCQRLLGPTLEAEDIAQEAALQAFLGLSRLQEPARFSAWLHAIAANLARMALRRRMRLHEIFDDRAALVLPHGLHTPEDVVAAREAHDMIVAALNELSAVNREVVIGFYLEGYSYADLAELLGVPVSAIRGRLSHGRRHLRRVLQPLVNDRWQPDRRRGTTAKQARLTAEAPWRRRFRGSLPPTPVDTLDDLRKWQWRFEDTRGDEFGRWYITPAHGGEYHLADPALPPAYCAGIAIGADFAIVGSATAQAGFTVHLVRPGTPSRLLYQYHERAEVVQLSRDETLVCIRHAEHGDWYHPALRVLDLHGTTIGDLWDGLGWGLWAGAWSPIAGDRRLIVRHEREGMLRPAIWLPESGQMTRLTIDLAGEIDAEWYPDAKALLLIHELRGRHELYRFCISDGNLTRIPAPPGEIWAAGVRPNSEIWYGCSSSSRPPEVYAGKRLFSRSTGEGFPGGVAYTDIDVDGVHGFLVEPRGSRPHPTIFRVNSHPSSHFRDSYSPVAQTWVDHGFAVVIVNGRGSSGYGKAWRDAPIGNVGRTELGDIAMVQDWAVASGIADPTHIVLFGEGWGGYLTLLGLGTQPERWTLGIAEKPIGDLAMCYEDVMEPLKAMMRAQIGGSPATVPEAYRRSSPMSYIERVRAPVLVIGGANDARCPIRQIEQYVARLREIGKPHEFYRYDGGFMMWEPEERIHQAEMQLAFAARHLGTRLPG
jgi:RNA polymerase sigma factor (sigma-70 family)